MPALPESSSYLSCTPDEVSSCRSYSQGVCQRFPLSRLVPALSPYDVELRAKPKESHIMTGTNQRTRSQTKPTCCEIRHSMYFTTGSPGTKSNLGGSGAWKRQSLLAPWSSFFDVS